MTTATAPAPEKIGGLYDWERGADGKYTIKAVEVFSAHERGENGVDREVTDAWIDDATEKLKANQPKHMIPVTYSVEHRSETKKHLGFLRVTHAAKVHVNGRMRNTMFGDVVGIEPADFDDFKRVKYPFRSASIASFSQHRFIDLSMLREGPGYYEYPILSLKDKDKDESPLRAYHAKGDDAGEFLYAFGSNDKKKAKKPDDKKKGDDKSKSKKPDGDGSPDFGKDKGDGEDGGDGDGDGEEGEFGEDGEDVQESPTDGMGDSEKLDKILAIVTQLMKDSCPSENDVNGDKAPSQDVATKKPNYSVKKEDAVSDKKEEKKDGAPAPESKPDVKAQIEADAKYAALEDRTAKLEAKNAARENAEKAIADLETAGYRLTKSTKEKIAHYSAKGADQLSVYVETYKAHAEKDPPDENTPAAEGEKKDAVAAPKLEGEPEEIAAYAANNPTDKSGIELRRRLLPEYEMHKSMGGSIPTFERFVEVEFKSAKMMGSVKE